MAGARQRLRSVVGATAALAEVHLLCPRRGTGSGNRYTSRARSPAEMRTGLTADHQKEASHWADSCSTRRVGRMRLIADDLTVPVKAPWPSNCLRTGAPINWDGSTDEGTTRCNSSSRRFSFRVCAKKQPREPANGAREYCYGVDVCFHSEVDHGVRLAWAAHARLNQ